MDVLARLKNRVATFESIGIETELSTDMRDAIAEIELLRKQFLDVMPRLLNDLKKTQAVIDDTRDRLERAGL